MLFRSGLYAALLLQKSDLIKRGVDGVLAGGGSLRARIEQLFRVRVDVIWEQRRFFRLFFHETMNPLGDPRAGFTPEIRVRYEEFLGTLENLYAEGISNGEFRDVPPRLLTLAFEGILHGYIVELNRSEAPERDPAEEDHLLELFFEGALKPKE